MTRFLLYCFTTAVLTSSAAANTLTLNFNSLPSTQGWTFVSGCGAEAGIFSVSAGVLHQNTIGCGLTSSEYDIHGVVGNQPYAIGFTTRVTAEETFSGGSVSHQGLSVGVQANNEQYVIGLGPGFIIGDDGSTGGVSGKVLSTSIDTTLYHSYLLSVTPGVGYVLYVDGANIGSGVGVPFSVFGIPPGTNLLFFGDATSFRANAAGDITAFGLQSTPEPTSILLLPAGVLFLGIMARSMRASGPREH
jgi:hypothetical protein